MTKGATQRQSAYCVCGPGFDPQHCKKRKKKAKPVLRGYKLVLTLILM